MGKKDGEARLEIAAEDLSGGGSDDGDDDGDDDDCGVARSSVHIEFHTKSILIESDPCPQNNV